MLITSTLIFLGVLMFLCGAHFIKETTFPDIEMLGVILCILGFALSVAGLTLAVAGFSAAVAGMFL